MKSGSTPDPTDSATGASEGSGVLRPAQRTSAVHNGAQPGSAEPSNAEKSSAQPNRPARSGRRPGNPDTRQVILDAARAIFAEVGFASASIRKIAVAAGVDAALVHHYFGSKEKLFLATVEVPVDLPQMIAGLGAEGTDGLGVRLATMMLGVWESPAGAGIGAALRTALADPARAKMLREFVVPQLIGPLLRPLNLPPDELEVRAGLVISQVLGVITGRYLLTVEPLASMPVDVLAANVGATLQRYFDDPLADLPEPQEPR
jgi:AcrR family transcriptional regulator